jgi:hypothetical protein
MPATQDGGIVGLEHLFGKGFETLAVTGNTKILPEDREVARVFQFERYRLERGIQRQQLNAVVPPAVGGDGLLRVVLLDGEAAAALTRAGSCPVARARSGPRASPPDRG